MTSLVLGPLFSRPLHPSDWKRPVGNRDYRVTAHYNSPDILNGGQHQAVDAGNFEVGWPLLAPASCPAIGLRHFDGAVGARFALGGDVTLECWHLNVVNLPSDRWTDVTKGQEVGKTGNTGAKLPDGSPMPAHTHIELKRAGVRVDPEPHLFGAPVVIEEDDMKIPATSVYLVRGVVGPGNRLRVDPSTAEGSKVIGTDIGEPKAYTVRIYERGVPGEPYTLGGKAGSAYAFVGVFGQAWYVAEPLVTDVALTGAGLELAPKADCSAERNKLVGARTAVSGARQAIEAAEALLA